MTENSSNEFNEQKKVNDEQIKVDDEGIRLDDFEKLIDEHDKDNENSKEIKSILKIINCSFFTKDKSQNDRDTKKTCLYKIKDKNSSEFTELVICNECDKNCMINIINNEKNYEFIKCEIENELMDFTCKCGKDSHKLVIKFSKDKNSDLFFPKQCFCSLTECKSFKRIKKSETKNKIKLNEINDFNNVETIADSKEKENGSNICLYCDIFEDDVNIGEIVQEPLSCNVDRSEYKTYLKYFDSVNSIKKKIDNFDNNLLENNINLIIKNGLLNNMLKDCFNDILKNKSFKKDTSLLRTFTSLFCILQSEKNFKFIEVINIFEEISKKNKDENNKEIKYTELYKEIIKESENNFSKKNLSSIKSKDSSILIEIVNEYHFITYNFYCIFNNLFVKYVNNFSFFTISNMTLYQRKFYIFDVLKFNKNILESFGSKEQSEDNFKKDLSDFQNIILKWYKNIFYSKLMYFFDEDLEVHVQFLRIFSFLAKFNLISKDYKMLLFKQIFDLLSYNIKIKEKEEDKKIIILEIDKILEIVYYSLCYHNDNILLMKINNYNPINFKISNMKFSFDSSEIKENQRYFEVNSEKEILGEIFAFCISNLEIIKNELELKKIEDERFFIKDSKIKLLNSNILDLLLGESNSSLKNFSYISCLENHIIYEKSLSLNFYEKYSHKFTGFKIENDDKEYIIYDCINKINEEMTKLHSQYFKYEINFEKYIEQIANKLDLYKIKDLVKFIKKNENENRKKSIQSIQLCFKETNLNENLKKIIYIHNSAANFKNILSVEVEKITLLLFDIVNFIIDDNYENIVILSDQNYKYFYEFFKNTEDFEKFIDKLVDFNYTKRFSFSNNFFITNLMKLFYFNRCDDDIKDIKDPIFTTINSKDNKIIIKKLSKLCEIVLKMICNKHYFSDENMSFINLVKESINKYSEIIKSNVENKDPNKDKSIFDFVKKFYSLINYCLKNNLTDLMAFYPSLEIYQYDNLKKEIICLDSLDDNIKLLVIENLILKNLFHAQTKISNVEMKNTNDLSKHNNNNNNNIVKSYVKKKTDNNLILVPNDLKSNIDILLKTIDFIFKKIDGDSKDNEFTKEFNNNIYNHTEIFLFKPMMYMINIVNENLKENKKDKEELSKIYEKLLENIIKITDYYIKKSKENSCLDIFDKFKKNKEEIIKDFEKSKKDFESIKDLEIKKDFIYLIIEYLSQSGNKNEICEDEDKILMNNSIIEYYKEKSNNTKEGNSLLKLLSFKDYKYCIIVINYLTSNVVNSIDRIDELIGKKIPKDLNEKNNNYNNDKTTASFISFYRNICILLALNKKDVKAFINLFSKTRFNSVKYFLNLKYMLKLIFKCQIINFKSSFDCFIENNDCRIKKIKSSDTILNTISIDAMSLFLYNTEYFNKDTQCFKHLFSITFDFHKIIADNLNLIITMFENYLIYDEKLLELSIIYTDFLINIFSDCSENIKDILNKNDNILNLIEKAMNITRIDLNTFELLNSPVSIIYKNLFILIGEIDNSNKNTNISNDKNKNNSDDISKNASNVNNNDISEYNNKNISVENNINICNEKNQNITNNNNKSISDDNSKNIRNDNSKNIIDDNSKNIIDDNSKNNIDDNINYVNEDENKNILDNNNKNKCDDNNKNILNNNICDDNNKNISNNNKKNIGSNNNNNNCISRLQNYLKHENLLIFIKIAVIYLYMKYCKKIKETENIYNEMKNYQFLKNGDISDLEKKYNESDEIYNDNVFKIIMDVVKLMNLLAKNDNNKNMINCIKQINETPMIKESFFDYLINFIQKYICICNKTGESKNEIPKFIKLEDYEIIRFAFSKVKKIQLMIESIKNNEVELEDFSDNDKPKISNAENIIIPDKSEKTNKSLVPDTSEETNKSLVKIDYVTNPLNEILMDKITDYMLNVDRDNWNSQTNDIFSFCKMLDYELKEENKLKKKYKFFGKIFDINYDKCATVIFILLIIINISLCFIKYNEMEKKENYISNEEQNIIKHQIKENKHIKYIVFISSILIMIFDIILIITYLSGRIFIDVAQFRHESRTILTRKNFEKKIWHYLFFDLIFFSNLSFFVVTFVITLIAVLKLENYYLYTFLLLYFIKFIKKLSLLFKAFLIPIFDVILMIGFLICLVWIFTLFSFKFIRKMFDSEENNNEIKRLCGKIETCFLTFLDNGIRNSDGIGSVIEKNITHDYFYNKFFFEIIFFIIFILLLLNMINGIIISTFTKLREESDLKENLEENVCYICNINRNKIDDFDDHKNNEHNVRDYIKFFISIYKKEEKDLSYNEFITKNNIEANENSLLPKNRYLKDDKEIIVPEENE
jgi:hypothetical protein